MKTKLKYQPVEFSDIFEELNPDVFLAFVDDPNLSLPARYVSKHEAPLWQYFVFQKLVHVFAFYVASTLTSLWPSSELGLGVGKFFRIVLFIFFQF